MGTLRPIAVGETFRRMTSNVAFELISDRARTILEPLQLGVKTPQRLRVPSSTPPASGLDVSKTAISVDISSAFNTVHRSAVLQSIRTHFPFLSLIGWTAVIATIAIFSRAPALHVIRLFPAPGGVQQGDPLGPVLFALAIHPIIQEARQVTENSFTSASTYAPSILTMASARAPRPP